MGSTAELDRSRLVRLRLTDDEADNTVLAIHATLPYLGSLDDLFKTAR